MKCCCTYTNSPPSIIDKCPDQPMCNCWWTRPLQRTFLDIFFMSHVSVEYWLNRGRFWWQNNRKQSIRIDVFCVALHFSTVSFWFFYLRFGVLCGTCDCFIVASAHTQHWRLTVRLFLFVQRHLSVTVVTGNLNLWQEKRQTGPSVVRIFFNQFLLFQTIQFWNRIFIFE